MIKTTLRIKEYLHNRVKLLAKHHNVSNNEQLIELIELGLTFFNGNYNIDHYENVQLIADRLEILINKFEEK